MYIRTREDALRNLAEVLDLPDAHDRMIQSTVRIMLCLDVEPRIFLADSRAFLIEGGLEGQRSARRASFPGTMDPHLEEVAQALDALRFAGVVRQVFLGLRAERWQVARAILLYESGIRERVLEGVHGRTAAARESLEEMIAALRPAWVDRLGAIRTACLEGLKRTDLDADRIHEEADLLYEIFTTSDDRAQRLLNDIDDDPGRGAASIALLQGLSEAARRIHLEEPPPRDGAGRVSA